MKSNKYVSFNDFKKEHTKESLITEEELLRISEMFKPKIFTFDISNVENFEFDKSKPILQFEDKDGVIENICNVKDITDGLSKMTKIFKDSNYKNYYVRILDYPDYYWIDYGSHTTFFRVTKTGTESLGDING